MIGSPSTSLEQRRLSEVGGIPYGLVGLQPSRELLLTAPSVRCTGILRSTYNWYHRSTRIPGIRYLVTGQTWDAAAAAAAVVVVVIVVLTSTGRYNAVRDHRAGSNRSGVEDYLRRKTKGHKKKDDTHYK